MTVFMNACPDQGMRLRAVCAGVLCSGAQCSTAHCPGLRGLVEDANDGLMVHLPLGAADAGAVGCAGRAPLSLEAAQALNRVVCT